MDSVLTYTFSVMYKYGNQLVGKDFKYNHDLVTVENLLVHKCHVIGVNII